MKKIDIPRHSMYNIHRVSRYCYREVAPVETKYPALAEAAMGDPAEIGRELGKLYDPLWLWLDRLVLGLLVWPLFWGIFLGIEYLSIFMGEWGRP